MNPPLDKQSVNVVFLVGLENGKLEILGQKKGALGPL
jgi:hypothetical protein